MVVVAVTLAAPAPFLTPDEVRTETLRGFKVLDANNDGVITSNEGLAFSRDLGLGLTNEAVQQEFEALDTDQSGALDFAEVRPHLAPKKQTFAALLWATEEIIDQV